MKILLIHPPVSKPCEPPAGIARLAGALTEHGIPCLVVDANVEGLHFLLSPRGGGEGGDIGGRTGDTWTKRALSNLPRHLQALRSWPLYGRDDRYRRAVADINRVLAGATAGTSAAGHERSGHDVPIRVSLADYEDASLSPRQSTDLLRAAAQPERSPFHPYFHWRFTSLLREHKPDIIGISINYFSQALCAFALIGLLRELSPSSRVVLGGGLVTSWLRQSQRRRTGEGNNPFPGLVDELVAGPGEGYLLSLAGQESGRKLSRDDLPVGSEVIASCPDYRSFPWDRYLAPGPIVPYSASTGCYWRRCRFCPERAERNPYRPLPVRKVLADLERLRGEANPVLVHFLDNALSPVMLAALAEERPGVPWYGFVRITEDLADPAFCRRLRDGGCVMLKLGLESGDQEVLDTLEKGISLPTATLVLRNLKEAGIGTYVYLLFGTPAEDRVAALRTREYVVANSPWIDFLNVAIFNMPIFAAAGLATRPFSAGDLSLYTDFEHPRGWNRREVRRFVEGEVRKHPAIAAVLKCVPRIFTSNHAPLLGVRLTNRHLE